MLLLGLGFRVWSFDNGDASQRYTAKLLRQYPSVIRDMHIFLPWPGSEEELLIR